MKLLGTAREGSQHRRSLRGWRGAAIGAGLLALSAAAPAQAPAPLGLPAVAIPIDNPLTPAKIALGRKLFMDRRLSPNNTMSCAMCHVPEQGFAVNEMATAIGFEGKSVRRNAPTLLNVAYAAPLLRDGAEASLESQVWRPLLAPNEMANASADAVVAKLGALADYRGLFEAAFAGRGPSKQTIGAALASYERTLNSANSRFDRWFFGHEAQALSSEAQRGFEVFNLAGCPVCHRYSEDSALFTDNRFHDIGSGARRGGRHTVQLAPGVSVEIEDAALASVSEPAARDEGRFEVTGRSADKNAFRTPSLRNVALTAPYMHDGSLPTLESVIEFYRRVRLANLTEDARVSLLALSEQDQRALIAFLRSLSGDNVQELTSQARAAFKDYPAERE